VVRRGQGLPRGTAIHSDIRGERAARQLRFLSSAAARSTAPGCRYADP
jgi:hypothetical protein